VKKWISISLLSVYLISTTELYQLLKIPFFVEHYIEHKGLNHNLTVWEFMTLHYFGDDLRDDDDAKDMQLPFKSNDGYITLNILAFFAEPVSILYLPADAVAISLTTCTIYEKVFIPSSYSSSIWQPPKFC
jgi:hypothetical protein